KLSIKNGGFAPLGEYKSTWIFKQLETIGAKYGFKLTDSIENIPQEAMEMILNGGNEKFSGKSEVMGITREYKIECEGISNCTQNQVDRSASTSIKRSANECMDEVTCTVSEGSRLKTESLYFTVNGPNISNLPSMDIAEWLDWFNQVDKHLSEKQESI